jgi:soluble lytic murein transglycosylase-like protein
MTLNAQFSPSAPFDNAVMASATSATADSMAVNTTSNLSGNIANNIANNIASNFSNAHAHLNSLTGLTDSLQHTSATTTGFVKQARSNVAQALDALWVAVSTTVGYATKTFAQPKVLLITVNVLAVAVATFSIVNASADTATPADKSASALPLLNVSSGLADVNAPSGIAQLSAAQQAQQDQQNQLMQQSGFKLSKESLRVVQFLAKKYHLASSELEKYIYYAEQAAKAKNLDPSLVLAVISMESGFNPIVESPVGAQGLMQVMTSVHRDKYAAFGGAKRAFDADANIAVGTKILADCIKLAGNVELGLKYYVGATGPSDNGYGAKVLAEKDRIEKARLGAFDFSSGSRPSMAVSTKVLANNNNNNNTIPTAVTTTAVSAVSGLAISPANTSVMTVALTDHAAINAGNIANVNVVPVAYAASHNDTALEKHFPVTNAPLDALLSTK